MLYVSTRNKTDSFTTYRAIHEEHTPDGGMYVPFQFPVFRKSEIIQLMGASFSENVARILNQFLSVQLNSWDVDFCVGRYPFKLVPMNHKIVMAELWHNPMESYQYLLDALAAKFADENARNNSWMRVVIGIAVLFGLYAENIRAGGGGMDIAVGTEDFSAPLSAFYARKMGLPIGNIICCFQENSNVWNLIHHGELSTASSVPDNLERFIYASLGLGETQRYVQACSNNQTYKLNDTKLQILNRGIFAAVIGENRIDTIISSVNQTNSYAIAPSTALSYGGLQDYRARTGESRDTLLLAYCNPK